MKKALFALVPLFLASSPGEATQTPAALHCTGSAGSSCSAGVCSADETNHVDATIVLAKERPRAKVCIGESCFDGKLAIKIEPGTDTVHALHQGIDERQHPFVSYIAISHAREQATLSWSDGALVSTVYLRCSTTKP